MQGRGHVIPGAGLFAAFARLRMAIGLALVAAGVLVAVWPEILVILLAALLISTGLGTFAAGWSAARRARRIEDRAPTYVVHDDVFPR